MSKSKKNQSLVEIFISGRFTISLFIVFSFVLIVWTALPNEIDELKYFINALLALIAICIILCTINRIRTLTKTTVIIHAGIIITLIGSVISSAGYVATVNIYEGSTSKTVYRWDIKKDIIFAKEIKIDKINREFFPVGIKIGVLRDNEKYKLIQTRTEQSFTLGNYSIRPHSLNVDKKELLLDVYDRGEKMLGRYAIGSEKSDLPAGFPYSFKLVAYLTPVLKRIWVDIALMNDDLVIAKGTSEANAPFTWEGFRFFMTRIDFDQYGNQYAGIQIVKDPGVPVVYFGFCIIVLGLMLHHFNTRKNT